MKPVEQIESFRFPLSIDCFRDLPGHIEIDQREDRKKTIDSLSGLYTKGFEKYATQHNIFNDLPDDRLWPDKYTQAYNWLQSAWFDLQGSPRLIFDELIRNADMHGKGFRGASAAWVTPSAFVFRIADQGLGFQSSSTHGDGIGLMFVGDFLTEQPQSEVQNRGHVLGLCRDLDKIRLPDQTNMFGDDISTEIEFVRQRRSLGRKLPQYHPNSHTIDHYDTSLSPFGGFVTKNLLGDVIRVTKFDKEPESWD